MCRPAPCRYRSLLLAGANGSKARGKGWGAAEEDDEDDEEGASSSGDEGAGGAKGAKGAGGKTSRVRDGDVDMEVTFASGAPSAASPRSCLLLVRIWAEYDGMHAAWHAFNCPYMM